ncbi:MbcA/ParS/Xre antitoxin family protein [Methylotenera sp.]|uniref:MbcA/ParS/Xre antitoxin family protein n=1 Tax=Methylotenera sp. TaxID=2051956 RepID=UPI00273752E4|nr:MbcA/ParS/Xre antitoxin family protein [Methylotenera sp.]MDP3210110.1 MbcA/ParS/Xre antitoxin family protein [Methylotenera sp.]
MTTKSMLPSHLAEIHALAVETFGAKSKAENWLNGFHPLLNNTPIAAAETASGAIEVKKILIAISHGGVV